MKKQTFYSIVFVVILLLTGIVQSFAQTPLNGQEEVWSFYFEASSSTLPVSAMETIDSLEAEGWLIIGATGVANKLHNTRRNIANENLARERALSLQDYLDRGLDWTNSYVVESALASDRRVDVVFVFIGEMDANYLENLETDKAFAEDTIVTNNVQEDSTVEVVMLKDTVLTSISDSNNEPNEMATENTDICECVEANVVQLWETYKQLQDDARIVLHTHGMRSPEYRDLLNLATETKLCWEFARGVRSSKAKMNRHCSDCQQSGVMSAKNNKKSARKRKAKIKRARFHNKVRRAFKNLKDRGKRFLDRVAPFRNC